MASVYSIEADFECPLEQLWSFVSHVPNQDHWVFGMSSSEVKGGGEITVGSEIVGTSTERGDSRQVTMVVRAFDPPNRVSWENTDGFTPFETVIECSGDERSSRMRYEVTLYPTSRMMRLMLGPLSIVGNLIANKMLRDEIIELRKALGLEV